MNDKKPISGSAGDSWESWGNHVLSSLEKQQDKVDRLEEKINNITLNTQRDIVVLKTKAAVIGSIAGLVVGGLISLVVGIFVYQLTVGKTNMDNRQSPKDRPPISIMLPPAREDGMFNCREGDDIIS